MSFNTQGKLSENLFTMWLKTDYHRECGECTRMWLSWCKFQVLCKPSLLHNKARICCRMLYWSLCTLKNSHLFINAQCSTSFGKKVLGKPFISHYHHHHHHQGVLPKGRSFTAGARTKVVVLPKATIPPQTQEPRLRICPKGRSSLQIQEPRLQFYPKEGPPLQT